MKRWWQQLLAWLRQGKRSDVTAELGVAEEPQPAKQDRRGVATYTPYGDADSWRRKFSGSIRNREISLVDVLDSLDDYFQCFRDLKKIDAPAWRYFSRVGLPIAGGEYVTIWESDFQPAPIADRDNLPTYIGVYCPWREEEDRKNWDEKGVHLPEITYMQRVKPGRGAMVLASPDTVVYRVISIYLRRRWATRNHPLTKTILADLWYIGIDADGICRSLPFRWFNHRGGKTYSGFGQCHEVRNMSSRSPFVKSRLEQGTNQAPVDIWAQGFFGMVRGMMVAALDGVEISFRRGNLTARLGVPIQRVPQFFADRNVTIEADGRRHRIFHSVVAHERHLKDGRVQIVGEHFRGERRFMWKGYEVLISLPGIHHTAMEALDVNLHEYDEGETIPTGMVDAAFLGPAMAKQRWRKTDNAGVMKKGSPAKRYRDNPLLKQVDRQKDQETRAFRVGFREDYKDV